MIRADEAERLIGAVAFDREHDRIGEVRQVIRDSGEERMDFVGVDLLGTEVLIPLEGAEWDDPELQTAVTQGVVRSAPSVEPGDRLSELDRHRLLRHYGIPAACTPRSEVDLDALADGGVSYSVKDDDMRDDEDSTPAATSPDVADDGTGAAMQQAATEHDSTVTGRMLGGPRPAEE